MRAKILAFRRTVSSLVTRHGARKYATASDHCDAHMNELPVPCGSWEQHHKERNKFYNAVLLSGIAWWVFSFALMVYTDSVYLNWYPPAQPGPPSDMVEECEDDD